MPFVRAHVYITGRVQGVFFRAYTRDMAGELGLRGWVRNLRDGRVEAVFEGEKAAVEDMLRWCRKGPPHARVEAVDAREEEYTGEFEAFGVRY